MTVEPTPMFPLGSVLLPGMLLPLHVFEDRYRRLVEAVLDLDEPEFGVTLIERGSEVGGGDIRAMVGCVARVLEAGRTDDGRWALVTVGTRPIRVLEWLPDDPFPRARTSALDDDPTLPPDAADRVGSLAVQVRRCLALASELGSSGPVDVELSEDVWLATYQAAVLACVAREVYSIERLRGLHDKARENLRPLRLANVHLLFGDGMLGYAQGAPYAGIIAAAGGEAVPAAWTDQLAMGGRLVAPTVMPGGRQALVVIDRTPAGLQRSVLEAVHFVPLKSGTA